MLRLLLLLALGQPLALSPTDGPANRAAIHAALAANRRADLPPGTWPVATPLYLERERSKLLGAGVDATILRATGSGPRILVGFVRYPLAASPDPELADRPEVTGRLDATAGRRWGIRTGPVEPPKGWNHPTSRVVAWESSPPDSGRLDFYRSERALTVALKWVQWDADPDRYFNLAGLSYFDRPQPWALQQLNGELWFTFTLDGVGFRGVKVKDRGRPGVTRELVVQLDLDSGRTACWLDRVRVATSPLGGPVPAGSRLAVERPVPFQLGGSGSTYGGGGNGEYWDWPGDTTYLGLRVGTTPVFDDSGAVGSPLRRADGAAITDAGLLFDARALDTLACLELGQPADATDREVVAMGPPRPGEWPLRHVGLLVDPARHTINSPDWFKDGEVGGFTLVPDDHGYGSGLAIFQGTDSRIRDFKVASPPNRGLTTLKGPGWIYNWTGERLELCGVDAALDLDRTFGAAFRDIHVTSAGRMVIRGTRGGLVGDRLWFNGWVARPWSAATPPLERTHLIQLDGCELELRHASFDCESGEWGTVAGIEATHRAPEGQRGVALVLDGIEYAGLAAGRPLLRLVDSPSAAANPQGIVEVRRLGPRTDARSGPIVKVEGRGWRGDIRRDADLTPGVAWLDDRGGGGGVKATGGPGPIAAPSPNPPAAAPALAGDQAARQVAWSMQLLKLHNAERAKAGRAPLTLDTRLIGAAWDQAADCGRRETLTHQGADGSWPWDRVTRRGYSWAAAGENAAAQPKLPAGWPGPDPRTAAWAMQGWMASPGHRANVLSRDFTQMGAAVVEGRLGTRYWVVTFARPR